MGWQNSRNVSVLLGQTLTKIDGGQGDGELIFHTSDGKKYQMYHSQDCCEHVYLQDVIGDLNDLIGSPLTMAEEISEDEPFAGDDSYTWTFYRFATLKGYVTLRWLGESNGYYSESVDFEEIT